MTTLTVYADTADSTVESFHATYSTARNGSGLSLPYPSTTLGLADALAAGTYYLDQSFISFDTSGVPDGATISSAVLSLYGKAKTGSPTFTIEACVYDWSSGGVTTADWRDGTALGGLTPVATFASSGWSTSAYNDFSDTGAGLASVVNKTGTTYLIVLPGTIRTNSAPSGNVGVTAHSADTTGTTNDPKLVITYTEGVLATPTTLALTTAAFAPTVTASDHKTATPSTLALTLSTFAPTVSTPQLVTPTTLALTTASFAPTVLTPVVVTPTTLALSLSALAPTVTVSGNKLVTPDPASLSMTAFAPTVVASDHKVVTPSTAALTLTTYAPVLAPPYDWAHARGVVTLSDVSAGTVSSSMVYPPFAMFEDADFSDAYQTGTSADATVTLSSPPSGVVTI